MTSGLILNPNVTWVSYNSLFDYGYLMRIITNTPLPIAEPTPENPSTPLYSKFLSTLEFYLKRYFDLKAIINTKPETKKYQLKVLAQMSKVPPLSPQNQSGSNAMLTLRMFVQQYNEKVEKDMIFVLCGIDERK